jgi:Ca2+-binding RTX toxin-like protein
VIEALNGGIDTVKTVMTLTLGANVERGQLLGGVALSLGGNGLNNTLTGNTAGNTLNGAGGSDVLAGLGGNDVLTGGGGIDVLRGGLGRDSLRGSSGNDRFEYLAVTESTIAVGGRDLIQDFVHGHDKIVLASIDAKSGLPGNQAFGFIGGAGFSAAGQVRVTQSGGHTFVDVNTGGSLAPEMRIEFATLVTLTAGDFVL